MSIRRFSRRFQWATASCLLGCLPIHAIVALRATATETNSIGNVVPNTPVSKSARLATYKPQAGEACFALSLKSTVSEIAPEVIAKSNSQRKVVVLVDTSASQTGVARTQGISSVRELVNALSPDTQVAIMACDVEAVNLSEGLQAPNSPAIEKAFARLDARVPLGTTDLELALRSANKLFENTTDNSIVYVGDGIIRSRTLNQSEFQELTNFLVSSKTSVTSMAIGPILDVEGLATLANHTGGRIYVHSNMRGSDQQIGLELAMAATSPVLWVDTVSLPKSVLTHYPVNVPPLRFDRDSILLGTCDVGVNSKESLSLEGTIVGDKVAMVWDVVAEASNPDFAFVGKVIEKAADNQGLYLPTAGSDFLRQLGVVMSENAAELVRTGKFALDSGDLEGAKRIVAEAIERDPNNLEAQNLLDVISKEAKAREAKDASAMKPRKFRFIQVAADEDIFGAPLLDDATATGEIEVPPAAEAGMDTLDADASNEAPLMSEDAIVPSTIPALREAPAMSDVSDPIIGYPQSTDGLDELASAGDLLSREEGARRLAAERFETEVRATLRDSQSAMLRDPVGVEMALKSTLSDIRRAPELEPGARARLQALVSAQIQSASRSAALFREQSSRTEAVRSAASSSERLLAERERAGASVQQLVERFNALMSQQLFAEANTEIAPAIKALVPLSTIERVTELESSITSNYRLVENVIYEKRRNFIDVMYLNEKVSIPFADEPPIIYPPADVWRALDARRKERYGSIDLSAGASPSEKRIYKALSQEVKVDFTNVPLRSVIDTLRNDVGIPIIPDEVKISDAGTVTLEDPINLTGLPAISLRSALRLILEPLELTYVIEDEVMKITTKEEASARVLRLYPVGDLVVPIIQLGGGGGMGGGMGGGQGGGGMGGGGMGGGGMGGGGMGGGGMGGGGGQFDVTDAPSKSDSSGNSKSPKVAIANPKTDTALDGASTSKLNESTIAAAKELIQAINAADEKNRSALEQKLAVLVNSLLAEAKQILNKQKTDDIKPKFQTIIDVVSLALREGSPQPWMYEAMSLSMQVCEYPAADVRRVLLSAIDFSGDIEDAIKIGKYLIKHDMVIQGLEVLRDASRSEPLRADIYELALPAAVKSKSNEHLRWTCSGVLSQVWPESKSDLVEQAEIAAKASYIRLTEAGRVMDAKVFEGQLKNAMKRDLVVRISWTGQADLDLSVEEPSGSICSVGNPRTVSGGVLVNDGSAASSKDVEISETYACPQGYTGEYHVLISRVWGDVAGGKVTIDILSDFGSPEQSYQRHQIALSDKDPLIKVAVKNGHRETSITEVSISKANARKLELGRAVLAQQINGPTGSGGLSNGFIPGFGGGLGGNSNGIANPLFSPFRGAVGYRPNITVLPQGTFMQTLGVISGDRRYVRVSPAPNFTDIIQVDTFNFITGAGGGGAAGGAGGGGLGGAGAGGGGAF